MATRSIDWLKEIDAAEKRGYFTDKQITASGNWQKCAVGQHRQAVKKLGFFLDVGLFPNPEDVNLYEDDWNSKLEMMREVMHADEIDLENSGPSDQTLEELGSSFYDYVEHNDFKAARKCFLEINKRVEKLTGKAVKEHEKACAAVLGKAPSLQMTLKALSGKQ